MSTVVEIENAISRLQPAEIKAVADWLAAFMGQHATNRPPHGSAIEKWRGRGRLPAGSDVDEYLRLTRDGDGS